MKLIEIKIRVVHHRGCAVWDVGLVRLATGIVGSRPAEGVTSVIVVVCRAATDNSRPVWC